MSVSIRQIHPVFVGEVSGIDITRPLSRDEVAAVEAGMDRYAVLLFRDQKVTDEQQMAFSLNFGVLEDARGGNITKPEDRRLQVGMNDVSNLGARRAAHGARLSPAPVQPRQHAVALGQLVPRDPREVFAAVGARGESGGRQHRVRRHARGLRCARHGHESARSRTSCASTR